MVSFPHEYKYQCPYCDTEFDEDLKQCPRCGLSFSDKNDDEDHSTEFKKWKHFYHDRFTSQIDAEYDFHACARDTIRELETLVSMYLRNAAVAQDKEVLAARACALLDYFVDQDEWDYVDQTIPIADAIL